ncbi:MAG: hypothetical protein QOH61_2329 [Chloroflexota bacterium]|jgi:predicted thioesterase|nr:hypothetical protein [Chloroflexota bacterium]
MTDAPDLTGRSATIEVQTTPEMSASAYGNTGLEVLATPALVGLFERAAMAAIDGTAEPGWRSVGTSIEMRHLAATPIGETVTLTATVTAADGRALTFAIEARDQVALIGDGTHSRFVVNDERFMERLRRGREA